MAGGVGSGEENRYFIPPIGEIIYIQNKPSVSTGTNVQCWVLFGSWPGWWSVGGSLSPSLQLSNVCNQLGSPLYSLPCRRPRVCRETVQAVWARRVCLLNSKAC